MNVSFFHVPDSALRKNVINFRTELQDGMLLGVLALLLSRFLLCNCICTDYVTGMHGLIAGSSEVTSVARPTTFDTNDLSWICTVATASSAIVQASAIEADSDVDRTEDTSD